jgi:putative selenate reductase
MENFSRISIGKLYGMISSEFDNCKSILGIPEPIFFRPSTKEPFRIRRFGKVLDTPIGVAAGPHSQMAQNIIASWLCGARYIELKTVQTLDKIEVSKPCIDLQDEGYNCEWSQELKLKDSLDEYVNAWVLIHVLHHKLNFPGKPGIIFNMSVGYNLDGILKANVQDFFRGMSDSGNIIRQKVEELRNFYPAIDEINIPSSLSDNITLSTMHGCPPDEIEKIGLYLLHEKKLHTVIKLNPTLLGKETLRNILNTKLGFNTEVPDEAFAHDLKYQDAINIIRSLRSAAAEEKIEFGLKLTNTLESINNRKVFDPKEKMMYMSGRALHPLGIHLSARLQEDFNGELDISFSAGADCFNIADLFCCGFSTVTVCSDLLKPGGYGRLAQYIPAISDRYKKLNAKDPEELVNINAGEKNITISRIKNLKKYASHTLENKAYQKDIYHIPDIKSNRQLGLFDCIAAPCVQTCPSNQEIPQYMYHASRGELDTAMEVILNTNPFPTVCGMVCDHICQTKCTRINYDQPLLIREIKRYITDYNQVTLPNIPSTNIGLSVAIIGAGPSGLACAYFLKLAGFTVTVYETKDIAGGMISDAIPEFRLTEEAIRKDIEAIKKLGVEIRYGVRIEKDLFRKLKQENSFVYIAVGAQGMKRLGIEGENFPQVLNPLQLLSDIRRKRLVSLGKTIGVIGGGNTAMDVARTCKRITGTEGRVILLYRRTRAEMPADPDEVQAMLNDNIEMHELVTPVKINPGPGSSITLCLRHMELKGFDASGRPKPVEIKGSDFELIFDNIIPSPGQEVMIDFTDGEKLISNPNTFETQIEGVFMGGDAFRGGASIIRAIGDGRTVASQIIFRSNLKKNIKRGPKEKSTKQELMISRSRREQGLTIHEKSFNDKKRFELVSKTLSREEAEKEASRCLYCDELCNICVTVCPNRANISYEIKPISIPIYTFKKDEKGKACASVTGHLDLFQKNQVANLCNFCNECGNCSTFCPTSGRPFHDKPRFHITLESFKESGQGYYFSPLKDRTILISKQNDQTATLELKNGNWFFENENLRFETDQNGNNIHNIELFNHQKDNADSKTAAEMIVLYLSLKDILLDDSMKKTQN